MRGNDARLGAARRMQHPLLCAVQASASQCRGTHGPFRTLEFRSRSSADIRACSYFEGVRRVRAPADYVVGAGAVVQAGRVREWCVAHAVRVRGAELVVGEHVGDGRRGHRREELRDG